MVWRTYETLPNKPQSMSILRDSRVRWSNRWESETLCGTQWRLCCPIHDERYHMQFSVSFPITFGTRNVQNVSGFRLRHMGSDGRYIWNFDRRTGTSVYVWLVFAWFRLVTGEPNTCHVPDPNLETPPRAWRRVVIPKVGNRLGLG